MQKLSVCYVFLSLTFLCSVLFIEAKDDPVPIQPCELSVQCDSCLKNVSCLWCNSPKKCLDYPVRHVFPTSDDCGLSAARWGVCWLNFEALIISVSVIGGLLIIAITVCACKCCGCCCFARNKSRYQAEELRLDRERQDRLSHQEQRKQERMRKNDDIRRKYGLSTGGSQYKQFNDDEYNV